MKLIKEPHPLLIGLGSLAVCWLIVVVAHFYIVDLAAHAVMLGAFLPDWLLSFARITPWLWLAPAAVDGALGLAATKIDRRALRTVAMLSLGLLIVYVFLALAVVFYVSFTRYV